MSAYVIVEVDVHDAKRYEEYKGLAPSSIAAYGGRYLARGGTTVLLEGDVPPKRMVVIEFSSVERARAWHESREYRPARDLRQATAATRMIVVEGV